MTLLPGIAALSSRAASPIQEDATVHETAQESAEKPESDPAKKCRVAKSGVGCGDDQSS
jgi:hypothetical protein